MFRESLVMADDHHTGVSGKSWFSGLPSSYSAAPNDTVSFRWNESAMSCKETGTILDNSVVFQDVQKMEASNSDGSGMKGHRLPGNDWSQGLIQCKGGAASSMQAMLQEDSSSTSNFQQETLKKFSQDQKNCSAETFVGGRGNASLYMFNQIDQAINSGQPCLKSGVTCQNLPAKKFSMISTYFGSSPLTLLRGSFNSNSQLQESIYNDQYINYMNSNDIPSQCLKFPQLLNSNTPRQQPTNQLHFSNNTPFWKASAAAMSNVQSRFYPFPQTQLLADTSEEKPNCCNLTGKIVEEIHDSSLSMKKSNNTLGLKRSRIEMPSPFPTLKVRKEKLGDRITVLQQLVSPFGKTDTASVLFEAIKCIKFLHEQVNVLSIPYMKNGTLMQQKNYDKSEDVEGPKRDLKSSGLCLVPISITFAVANEIAADFWTPTYGGIF